MSPLLFLLIFLPFTTDFALFGLVRFVVLYGQCFCFCDLFGYNVDETLLGDTDCLVAASVGIIVSFVPFFCRVSTRFRAVAIAESSRLPTLC